MSNYFGALMRSSGLSVGADASFRALPTRPIPADYGIEEIVEERIVAQSPASPHLATPLDPAHKQARPGRGEGTAASGIETAPPRFAMDKATPATTAPMLETHASSLPDAVTSNRPTADHTPIGEKESNHTAGKDTPPAGSALVRAALRWVAAGESPAPGKPSMPAPRFGWPDVSEERWVRAGVEGLASEPTIEDRLEFFASPMTVQPVPARAAESPAILRDLVPRPQGPIPDHARDDMIEVSIGSIHVRVDALPPPAVAPAAPSPATRPAAEAPPRSGLSRRALWRI